MNSLSVRLVTQKIKEIPLKDLKLDSWRPKQRDQPSWDLIQISGKGNPITLTENNNTAVLLEEL